MATVTLGTSANNKITAVLWSNAVADADLATLNALAIGDAGPSNSPVGSGYLLPAQPLMRNGILLFPGRMGWVQILPGDYVGFGGVCGWPTLVSGKAAATADWTHT